MPFMNVVASVNGQPVKTKKAFKEHVKALVTDTPGCAEVIFRGTSPMGPRGIRTLGDLVANPDVTLIVVGPGEYDRVWFANVKINAKGKPVVS